MSLWLTCSCERSVSAFPTCEPLTQFSCSSGRCVSAHWRCDSGEAARLAPQTLALLWHPPGKPLLLTLLSAWLQTTTAGTAATKWAAPGPAPTPSSSAPAAAASRTTGPATGTTTAGTTAMKTPPAGAGRHVRTPPALVLGALVGGDIRDEKTDEVNKRGKTKGWSGIAEPRETHSDCLF